MIQFFRKIRQQLIRQNNMGKYFKYAIGEIILVVIGILIALQINNWNEHRKLLNTEKETIASLKLEFQKNLAELDAHIKDTKAIINAGNVLLNHTGPDYEFGSLKRVDSLISMTPRMAVWDPSLYTLSDIKTSGKLSNLSNEELKIALIAWESFYSNLLDWGDFFVDSGSKYFDYLNQHAIQRNLNDFGPIRQGRSKFSGTNEQLLKSVSFENILSYRVTLNSFMLQYYLDAQSHLNKIIDLCETY